jgi:S-DNA-T family DNA segregation ATPase FtsK/SpoIIIE
LTGFHILFFHKKSTALNSRRQVATPKNIRLIREAWWLVLVVIGVYLAAILFTYYPNDPSWSHSASDNAVVHNAGGAIGAWVSDMLLYLFGFSAWWWVGFAFYAMWLVYLRLEADEVGQRPLLLFNMVGFGLLLVASCSLEAGHIVQLPAILPAVSGGMLGSVTDEIVQSMFGFAGSTLVLLMLFAIGFSLFTGWSWLMMTEMLGGAIISAYHFVINTWQDRQDRQAGKRAEQLRTVFVENERKRVEDRPPVQIEKPAL